eukprot:1149804-Pleurochrysis_carterae.AAC.1
MLEKRTAAGLAQQETGIPRPSSTRSAQSTRRGPPSERASTRCRLQSTTLNKNMTCYTPCYTNVPCNTR